MATETEVKARLTLDAKQAKSQARSYQQSLQGIQSKIRVDLDMAAGLAQLAELIVQRMDVGAFAKRFESSVRR